MSQLSTDDIISISSYQHFSNQFLNVGTISDSTKHSTACDSTWKSTKMPLESIHEQNSNSSESESPQNLEGEDN